MIDKKEKIKRFIGRLLIRIRRISGVASIGLLILTNSLLLFSYIQWRAINPYVGIILISIGLTLLVLFAAYIYLDKLHMFKAEKDAEMPYLPGNVFLLTPYEQMMNKYSFVPMMEFMLKPNEENRKKLEKGLKYYKIWTDKGVIPKKHMPKKLWKYYISDKEEWF